MKRVLVLSNSASLQDLNNRSNLNLLINMDCEIHVGCNFVSGNTTSHERVEAFVHELKNAGVVCLNIRFVSSKNPFAKQPAAEEEIEKIISRHGYDLIHCLTLTALKIAGPAAAKHKIPVICTSYGLPVHKGSSVFERMYFAPKLKAASKYADTFICCNSEDRAYAEKNMKAKKVLRIPGTGLDPYHFRAPTVPKAKMREFMEIPQNAVTLITVAPLTSKKNHAVVIKAINALRKLNIHYVICGGGEKAESLYTLTRDLNLEDRIHFAKNRDDVVNMVHACDIFCLPSKEEGVGTAALEAMEAGLPLVTSDVQAFRDFMENGVTGYMCRPKSVSDVMAGIEALTEDRKLRMQIGTHNRTAVQEYYRQNTESIMQEVFAEYLEDEEDNAYPHEKISEKETKSKKKKDRKKSRAKTKIKKDTETEPEKETATVS